MAIDVRGLTNEYPEWGGLYKMADNLERRKLRQDQLAVQQQGKRGAAGTFLQNYLDPKDYMSGTAYDPMILQGLQEAMQSGAQLAMAGADTPTLMMALGPMVNRLSKYSTTAKTVNKQIDDAIAGMKADKQEGYNWAALKDQALRQAFYKTDEQGQSVLDLDRADPTVNWVTKAIEEHPDKVTTPEAFDVYAKGAPMNKSLRDITTYDQFGNADKSKAHLIAQNYLVPEMDEKTGRVMDFVPKYQVATNEQQPLLHNFMDATGKPVKAPVRLLDEGIFDSLPSGAINYLRGQVKNVLREHERATGEKISIDSPQAKKLAQAFAYNEFNLPNRKQKAVEYAGYNNKPSGQQVALNLKLTPEFQDAERVTARSRKQGRLDVQSDEEEMKDFKVNAVQAIGNIFNGAEDLSQTQKANISGTVELPNGSTKSVKDLRVFDVTGTMPKGELKAGAAEDHKFKHVYYSPTTKSLIVEKESGPEGRKHITQMEIPEANVGQFIYRIAEANGIPQGAVKPLLQKMGYNGGRFTKAKPDTSVEADDFETRKKKKSWKDSLKTNAFGGL